MKLKYILLDAFTKTEFQGAQIAVFPAAENISEGQKRCLARELNLSETVFIQSSNESMCNAKLEIFTPHGPCGFAGHAVVAACYAMGEVGIIQGSDARIELNNQQLDIILGLKNHKVQINIPIDEKYDDYVPSNKELAQIIGLDVSEIGCRDYRPAISGCPEPYLFIPVKNNPSLRASLFHENKWQLSFVASLATKIFIFTGEHPFGEVNFAARIVGRGIAVHDDPPIGAAAAAFGLYLSHGKNDYHRSCLIQRGDETSRISILEVNVDKKGSDVMGVQLGGHAVKMGEGYFDIPGE
ncbi:Phenazine biosynthesis protein PhzF like [hydrothermal vent metagenome]|uniref:Phenazine biosynthesis protein PhzF like n=1 Tax=hydrothermal vent metagenome TaxID=652676 RepID=A0A3B0XI17_9ZZZZ